MRNYSLAFLVVNLLFSLLPVLVLFYAYRKSKVGRQHQDTLLHDYLGQLSPGMWYRVRYASQRHFTTPYKITPWEASGIVSLREDAVTFYGYDNAGQLRELTFRSDDTRASWVGRRFWPNGGLQWFMLRAHGQEHYFTSDTGMTVFHSLTTTRGMFQQVTKTLSIGTINSDDETLFPAPAFALEKNPHTVAAMGAVGAMLLYAGVDFCLNTETYALTPWYPLYALAGGLGMLLVTAWLLRVRIPKTESLSLGVLAGLVLGLALYPGLLRLNQLTDRAGLQSYAYVLQQDLSLSAQEQQLPTLKFPSDEEYWAHLPPGSIHHMALRKGGLGFYQVDMAPLYDKLRDYYATKKEHAKGHHRRHYPWCETCLTA